MREDAGTGPAAALLMAPEENEVEVVPGVEGSPIEFRGLAPKAEQEGPGQDLVHVPIAEAARDPAIEELVVGLGTENNAKHGTRRSGTRRRTKARTKKFTAASGELIRADGVKTSNATAVCRLNFLSELLPLPALVGKFL